MHAMLRSATAAMIHAAIIRLLLPLPVVAASGALCALLPVLFAIAAPSMATCRALPYAAYCFMPAATSAYVIFSSACAAAALMASVIECCREEAGVDMPGMPQLAPPPCRRHAVRLLLAMSRCFSSPYLRGHRIFPCNMSMPL